MILFSNGENIRAADEFFVVPGYFALEFAGALLATFFWVSTILISDTLLCIFGQISVTSVLHAFPLECVTF